MPANDEHQKNGRREYLARNRERTNQRRRESRERMKHDHPEKWEAQQAQQEKNREYARERYRRLRDAGELGGGSYDPERRAKYLAEHPEKARQWRKTYYHRKKTTDPVWWANEQAKKRERGKLRGPRKRDPGKARLYHERSEARKAGLPLPPLPG